MDELRRTSREADRINPRTVLAAGQPRRASAPPRSSAHRAYKPNAERPNNGPMVKSTPNQTATSGQLVMVLFYCERVTTSHVTSYSGGADGGAQACGDNRARCQRGSP